MLSGKNIVTILLLSVSACLLAQENGKTDLYSTIYNLDKLSKQYMSNSMYDSAITVSLQEEKLTDELKSYAGLTGSYLTLGLAYNEEDSYSKATFYAFKALTSSEKTGNSYLKVISLMNIGIIYEHQGDFTAALKYYTKALEQPIDSDFENVHSQLEMYLGDVCRECGDYELSHTHFNASLKMREHEPDNVEEARAREGLALLYLCKRDTGNALKEYLKGLMVLNGNGKYKKEIAHLFTRTGEAYMQAHDSIKTFQYLARGSKIAEEGDYQYEELFAQYHQGLAFAQFTDTIDAIIHLSRALTIAEELKYPRGIAQVQVALGDIAKDSATRISYYSHASGIQQQLRLIHEQGLTLTHIAAFYINCSHNIEEERKQFTQAADSEIRAYNLLVMTGDMRNIAEAARGIGDISSAGYLAAQAQDYYLLALKIEKKYPYMKREMAVTMNGLGYSYFLKGDSLQAMGYYNQARVIQEDSGYKQELWLTYYNMGSYYSLGGKLDESITYFVKAADGATEIRDKKAQAKINVVLGAIYEVKKDTMDAFDKFFKAIDASRESKSYYQQEVSLYKIANIYFNRRRY